MKTLVLILAIFAVAYLAASACTTAPDAPENQYETATAVKISDGDTFWVRVKGVKKGKKLPLVRMIGLNTMEKKHSKKSHTHCHAMEARAFLSKLIGKKTVTLHSAQSRECAIGKNKRLLRSVRVKGKDVGALLVAKGHALAFPKRVEPVHNIKYRILQENAAAAGKGIWRKKGCKGKGSGRGKPQFGSKIRIEVTHYDPAEPAPNNEYVTIYNQGGNVLNLYGWHLRGHNTNPIYYFKKGVKIQPQSSLRVYSGSGTPTADRVYMGLGFETWDWPKDDGSMGNTAVLLDNLDNFRAWHMYPCLTGTPACQS